MDRTLRPVAGAATAAVVLSFAVACGGAGTRDADGSGLSDSGRLPNDEVLGDGRFPGGDGGGDTLRLPSDAVTDGAGLVDIADGSGEEAEGDGATADGPVEWIPGEGTPDTCGNKFCDLGENCVSCPGDCGSCPPCGDGVCGSGEFCFTCPADCGTCCGDGKCAADENCQNCTEDCGVCCPDGTCQPFENCTTCPQDCATCCGDGQCADDEDCMNCPADCGGCCGNGTCDYGESCEFCEQDCGKCCDPPNTLPINGKCVPSCGGAGGNTCVPDGSTMCDGLTLLESYDCAICCTRPPYPGAAVHSYHTVHKDDIWAWDSIWALAQAYPDVGPMINSQNKSDLVPNTMWAQRIDPDWYATGTEMADAMHQAFIPFDTAPRVIMIDELKTQPAGTIQKFAECADRMRTVYPQWEGRWGVHVVNGPAVDYSGLNPGLDALLKANAVLAVEMYPLQSDYCNNGSTVGQRDQWLADFFRGDQGAFPQHRFHWLMERRAQLGSNSHVSIEFAVTDGYMNGTSPAIFLDRLFYVWRNKSGYGSLIYVGNGGVGAWKWDEPDMSNTSRDEAFAESFNHYCVAQNPNSLKGQVPCP